MTRQEFFLNLFNSILASKDKNIRNFYPPHKMNDEISSLNRMINLRVEQGEVEEDIYKEILAKYSLS